MKAVFFFNILKLILKPILKTEQPEGAEISQKQNIKSFKEPKTYIFKNLEKPKVFYSFWLKRTLRKASRTPRRLPEDTLETPKTINKGSQNRNKK